MKSLFHTVILCFFICQQASAQQFWESFGLQAGTTFNASSDEFNSTTALGVFIEPSVFLWERWRFGMRIEPTALAYGILTLPGGCGDSCEEGANFLLINYLKVEYLLGTPKYGAKKGHLHQAYVGANVLMLTHRRHIITSREPGNWKDTRRRITNAGIGARVGALLGKIDLSASYNFTGDDFRNHFGFNLGYQIIGVRNANR